MGQRASQPADNASQPANNNAEAPLKDAEKPLAQSGPRGLKRRASEALAESPPAESPAPEGGAVREASPPKRGRVTEWITGVVAAVRARLSPHRPSSAPEAEAAPVEETPVQKAAPAEEKPAQNAAKAEETPAQKAVPAEPAPKVEEASAAVLPQEPTSWQFHVEQASSSASERRPEIAILAATLGGEEIEVKISPSEKVQRLAELLSKRLEVSPRRLKLIHAGGEALTDRQKLAECGVVTDGARLSIIILPPVPEWAEDLGLTYEHTSLLREFFATNKLEAPEWLESDDEIWSQLQVNRENVVDSEMKLAGWNHRVLLEQNGTPSSILRAKPGEELQFTAVGRIWNNKGDTCIQQLHLVMDATIVTDLHNSVPRRGVDIKRTVSMTAPEKPGVHMLWRRGDLQYSVADARRNCEREIGGRVLQKYPHGFVAWLVVQD